MKNRNSQADILSSKASEAQQYIRSDFFQIGVKLRSSAFGDDINLKSNCVTLQWTLIKALDGDIPSVCARYSEFKRKLQPRKVNAQTANYPLRVS